MRRPSAICLLLACTPLASAGPFPGGAPESAARTKTEKTKFALEKPFPGGVLDSTARTAFVRSSEGIAAIDLSAGSIAWHRREAQVPLLVAGDRLYALALTPSNKFSVLAFDLLSKAESVFQTEVTSLPSWARTLESRTTEFHYQWQRDGRHLTLIWQASARVTGGPAKKATGVVEVDLDSGYVKAKPADAVVPGGLDDAMTVPRQLERLSYRWHRRFNQQLFAAVLEDLPGSKAGHRHERLVLRSWLPDGRPDETRELARGKQLVVMPDLDDKHLWIRDAGDGGGPNPSRWRIFSGVSGSQVDRVPFVPGTVQGTVIERRAYVLAVSGRRLERDGRATPLHAVHAFDLDRGKLAWTCPLGK